MTLNVLFPFFDKICISVSWSPLASIVDFLMFVVGETVIVTNSFNSNKTRNYQKTLITSVVVRYTVEITNL